MRDHHDTTNDPGIEELFEASRLAHAESAPSFHETLHASHDATLRRWPARRAFAAATAATFAGGAVLALAVFALREPLPSAPTSGIGQSLYAPPATPEPTVVLSQAGDGSGSGSTGHADVEPRAGEQGGGSSEGVGPAVDGDQSNVAGMGATGTNGRLEATVDGVFKLEPLTGTFMSNINPDAIGSLQDQLVEKVQVKAKLIELDEANPSVTLTDTFLEDLPILGRSYQNALTLAPGVNDANNDGNLNVHGSRERDFKATVDGVSKVDPLTGKFNFEQANPQTNTESYGLVRENEFLAARENPLSTFSIDVDTASFANIRRFLEGGSLPPAAAVRIEELINYFPYDDPPPNGEAPFATRVEIAECPWNAGHRLARIALKAQDVSRHGRPPSNLVLLIDVSGSMNDPEKLPLVVSSLKQLIAELDGRDKIAMVVYAGASGLVLPPTPGSDRAAILSALDRLQAGGGTNGGEGLLLAYRTARKGFIPGGTNRVILATDGDFNLGVTDRTDLLDMIVRESGGGIFLTTLGFGMGNYKDDFLETLSDKGNGNYAYIDSPREARKVLVDGMGGTLVTVAKDVKIQVEFNPQRVESYRLIGYENRLLAKEDFNDDTKDAGEIGAGHSVTALYELVPAGASEKSRSVDPLRYQNPAAPSENATSAETLTVKLRYKEPEGKGSKLLEVPVIDTGAAARAASADFKFAASVAMFGMVLRNSPHRGEATLEGMQQLAGAGIGRDPGGYRSDFLRIAGIASQLRRAMGPEGVKGAQPVTP